MALIERCPAIVQTARCNPDAVVMRMHRPGRWLVKKPEITLIDMRHCIRGLHIRPGIIPGHVRCRAQAGTSAE